MVLPALLALPFCTPFFALVFRPPFQQGAILKSSEAEPKTAQIHEFGKKNIIEAHPQPRAAKRLRLRGVNPVKLTTFTTL